MPATLDAAPKSATKDLPHKVKDLSLADLGRKKIELAEVGATETGEFRHARSDQRIQINFTNVAVKHWRFANNRTLAAAGDTVDPAKIGVGCTGATGTSLHR